MNTQISKNFSFVYVIFFQMETVSHKLNQAINTLNPCRHKILKGHINYITKMLPVHIITEILVHVLKWWNANTHVIHVDNKLKKCLVISSIDLLRSRVICIGCFVLLQLWELRCWQKENFLVQPITEWLWPMRGKGFGHSICVIMLLCIFIEIGTRFVTPGF